MKPRVSTKFRILIFEDDDALGPLLRSNLETLGFVSRLVQRGDVGVEEFNVFRPHLVLLDLMMPGMNGAEVLSTLRAHSTVPIIVLSSLEEEDAGLATFRSGADDYVVKPFTHSLLMARIVAHLRRSYGYEPAATPVCTSDKTTASDLFFRQ